MRPMIWVLTISIGVLAGCKDDHDHPASAPASSVDAHDPHSHDAHDHHHHNHGDAPKEMLGLVETEGFEISAVQNGKLIPGSELNFDVEILGKSKTTAVRFWIGQEQVDAAAKMPSDQVKENVHHVDLTVPATIGAGTKLWVELDRAAGSPVRASFDLKKP